MVFPARECRITKQSSSSKVRLKYQSGFHLMDPSNDSIIQIQFQKRLCFLTDVIKSNILIELIIKKLFNYFHIKKFSSVMSAASGSLNFAEKKRLWDEAKYDKFEQISQDKSTMFNYFMENNDIFKMITPEDEFKFKANQVKCDRERANVFLGSVAAVILIDQVLFRYLAPNFKINRFRLGLNFLKYVIAPSAIAAIYKAYFMGDYQYFFYNMQQKYAFGFKQYMEANKIYDRALAVDRLEEFIEKRAAFDWTGIPQLPNQPATTTEVKK